MNLIKPANGHILVAEDSRTIQIILGRALERRGFSVSFAENIEEIIQQCSKQVPQILVLDLQLAHLDPRVAVQTVRAVSPKLQVVVFSGAKWEVVDQFQKREKVFASVAKTSNLDELLSAIDAAWAHWNTHTSLQAAIGTLAESSDIKRILLLDDDVEHHEWVKKVLADEPSIQVLVTTSIFVAAVIKRYKIDLVLVDIHLPGLRQGPDIVAFLKTMVFEKTPRLLLYSGKSAPELEALAKHCGADGWIQKQDPVGFKHALARYLRE